MLSENFLTGTLPPDIASLTELTKLLIFSPNFSSLINIITSPFILIFDFFKFEFINFLSYLS